jgi:Flp pilus assembly protein TadD
MSERNDGETDLLFRNAVSRFETRDIDGAALLARDLVQRFPGHAKYLHFLAGCEMRRGDGTAALPLLERAAAAAPDNPYVLTDLALALRRVGRLEDALARLDAVIAAKPGFAPAFDVRGTVLKDLRRTGEALAAYQQAIALKPDSAGPYVNLALVKLMTGDFADGWRFFEWRWSKAMRGAQARDFGRPRWLGKGDVAGRTVLVHGERGFGDVVQFVRYVPKLAALGAQVVVEAPAPLLPLLKSLPGEYRFVAEGEPLPEFDLFSPVMSLALAFDTALDSVPAEVPYLSVDPARRALWRKRLGKKKRPRIGLVWSGEPVHYNDHHRNIPVAVLAPLLGLPCAFHALNRSIRAGDRAALAGCRNLRFHEREIADYADTAALIEAMDLVITSDTTVAHIAGALGKPVWILLSWIASWRWMLNRADSPWYPTATLIRQNWLGDWNEVIGEVRARLPAALAQGTKPA